jgi:hypothetical protein
MLHLRRRREDAERAAAKRAAAERAAAKRAAAELDRTRTLADRYGVSIRTIERWCDAGILPPPMRINKRKFWPPGTRAKPDATP